MNPAGSSGEGGQNAFPEAGDSDFADVHLSDAVQETIGRSLKAHYDDIAKEPVPDKFLVLLAQLEAQELKGGQRDS